MISVPNELCNIINCATIIHCITKTMREQECLHSERNVLRPDSKDSEDTESFERNCQVWLQAISNMGMNILFFSERNVIIICVYLSVTH